MTYAEVAAQARAWLAQLPPPVPLDPVQAVLYRPLGAAMLVRWLRSGVLPCGDARAAAAAHAMLAAWVAASATDASPIAAEHDVGGIEPATRNVLLHALRDWAP